MKNEEYFERKVKVLTHYGNGKLSCVLCGFEDIRALSIDHINGGGAKHIKSLHKNFYDWLITMGYPDGFQTLCFNCQWIKKAQGSKHRVIRRRQSANTILPLHDD